MNSFRFHLFFKVSRIFSSTMLLVFVQSCANTPIGQQLANTFDSTEPFATQKAIDQRLLRDDSKETKDHSSKPKENNTSNIRNMTDKKVSLRDKFQRSNSGDIASEKKIPFNPQPYRITIKLSGANPSAPAETVTRALRKAGISFEVEMIERVNSQAGRDSFSKSTQRIR